MSNTQDTSYEAGVADAERIQRVAEVMKDLLGAEIVEDNDRAIQDGPGPQRLSAAFSEIRGMNGHLVSDRPGALRTNGVVAISQDSAQVLRFFRPMIIGWWWSSPSAIVECDQCGEPRFIGSRTTKKCNRFVPKPVEIEGEQFETMVRCTGTMRPLDPPFEGKRPRRRTVKVKS